VKWEDREEKIKMKKGKNESQHKCWNSRSSQQQQVDNLLYLEGRKEGWVK
jgi:hypothetical protein